MKIEELRIGNAILMNGKILFMDVRLFHAVIHGFHGYDPEPVPITEEWLVKAGFNNNRFGGFEKEHVLSNGCKIKYRVGMGSIPALGYSVYEGGNTISYGNMIYVHQLQNLYFALTGKEIDNANS